MVIPGGVAENIRDSFWRQQVSEVLELAAEARDRAGKGASRALRREGRVPAVIYGNNEDPQMVHVEEKILNKLLHTGHFFNSVVMVEVGGKKVRTLPKDVAFHPVSDRPLHADFLRVSEHATVHVNVPVSFVNEAAAPGIKRGGVLNIVRHEVELICDAAEIPDDVQVDLTGFDVGDSIHISAVTLPRGAKPAIEDRDFTIATIVAPSALKSSEGDTTKDGEGA